MVQLNRASKTANQKRFSISFLYRKKVGRKNSGKGSSYPIPDETAFKSTTFYKYLVLNGQI